MMQTILFAVPESRWTVKLAESIAGTLGNPSKLPGKAYGISAKLCNIGAKLALIPGSICNECYAMRDNYNYPSVKIGHDRRAAGLSSISWRDAMIKLISRLDEPHFRWFDSGDIQSFQMLLDIVWIAEQLPEFRFWLPTREKKLVLQYQTNFGSFPKNLVVRLSAAMIDVVCNSCANTSCRNWRTYPGPSCDWYCLSRNKSSTYACVMSLSA